jgi:Sigma-70, region 4
MRTRASWPAALAVSALLASAATAAAQAPPNSESGQGTVPKATPSPKATPAPTARAPVATPTPPVTTPAPPVAPVAPGATPRPAPSEPSSAKLRRRIRPHVGCIAALPRAQRDVIVRRAGVRGFKGRTRAEVARSLGLSRARVAGRERQALRGLNRAHCKQAAGKGKGTPASTPAATPAAVPALTSSSKADVSYAEDHPVLFYLAIGIALLCAILLVREVRRSFRTPA